LSPSSKIRAASREQAPAPVPLARAPSPIGSAPHKPGPSEACAAADDALDLEQILAGVKETAYRWDLASGRMIWAGNAAAVLDIADMAPLANARAFALLVDPEHASLRYDAITGGLHPAPDCQVSYRIHYRLLPDGRRGRKVEDSGLCQIGSDLAPLRAQGTLRVIDDRREQEERLLHLSSHDELTGQLNRTRLTEELSLFLSDAGRFARKGAFLLVAVNDLTLINETYGFDMGDEVISIVGRRLGRILRGKDRIGRFSSNKFGILLGDCTADGVATIASRLMASVRDSVVDASAGAVATSVSIGALLLPSHASTAQAAIGNALQALEAARNDHGGRFALYHPSERRESERRRTVTIADEIVRALNDRRMILALQPIVTSGSRETEFYECLLRMKRLDGSIAASAEFMPVAEQLGLAKLVDHRVLKLAIELLRASRDQARAQCLRRDDDRQPMAPRARGLHQHRRQQPDRASHHRDRRDRGDRGLRRDGEIRSRREGLRVLGGARRFWRGLHLLPQPEGAWRGHGQDRRLLHPESRHRSRGRAAGADADRPCPQFRRHHRWRTGGR
jgi:diguanylate cyclase (GGDEF)-like protein